MKTMKALFTVAIATLIAFGNTSYSQQDNSVIKLKGKVVSSHKVDVIVFSYDELAEEWVEVKSIHSSKRYSLNLDPQKYYTIVFMNDEIMKTVQVKKGQHGFYYKILDLDFDDKERLNACLFQDRQLGTYDLFIVEKDYNVVAASK